MLALRRLGAYAIDWLVFAIWAAGVTAIVVLANGGVGEWTGDPWTSQAIGALVTTLPFACYLAWCEAAPRGRTLGKRLRGLQVLDEATGAPPTLARSALRAAIKLLPWELGHTAAHQMLAAEIAGRQAPAWAMALSPASMALLAVYIAMLFVGDGRAPHDRIAGTRVART